MIDLVESLSRELKAAIPYVLSRQDQEAREVHVYQQSLPAENFEQDSFYPLVIVELIGVEHEVDDSVASVLLTIGTFDTPAEDWFREHMNLAERIQQYLQLHAVIGEKYLLQYPISFAMAEKTSDTFTFSHIFLQLRKTTLVKSYIE